MVYTNKKSEVIKVTWIAGFTFIEVIVALAIVSISLLVLLKLHLISIRMADSAHVTKQAVFVAEQKIAEVLAEDYPKVGSHYGTLGQNGALFNWRTEVTDLYSYPLNEANVTGLRKVLVDVSWKQGISSKHLQMSTYVADRKFK